MHVVVEAYKDMRKVAIETGFPSIPTILGGGGWLGKWGTLL